MTPTKKMFEPGRDMPNAFLTTTKKGKQVYRMYLNTDEIIARLEEGKTMMAIDIPSKLGNINIRSGSKNGRQWKSLAYYAWAVERKKEEVSEQNNV